MFRKLMLFCLALCLLCAPCGLAEEASSNKEPILACGGSFAYVRDLNGRLYVWGDNQFGQLGKGGTGQTHTPALFKTKNAEIDADHIRDIVAGCDYSFLIMDDGTVYGVGNNVKGALTCEYGMSTHVKIKLEDRTVTQMAAGFGQVLALNQEGTVYGWGRNQNGEAGIGSNADCYRPSVVKDLPPVEQIACGGKFSIALDREGRLWGWGDNEHHQISPDSAKSIKTPTVIDTGDIEIDLIDAGGSFVAVTDKNGDLYMWGINAENQLGFDNRGKDVTSPVKVDLPLPVKYLAVYSSQTYVILSDGSLWGWGNNTYGQLGLGFRTASGKGVTVSRIADGPFTCVQGGSLFMLAIREDGVMMAAGINKFGQLGLSTKEYEIPLIFENGFTLANGFDPAP